MNIFSSGQVLNSSSSVSSFRADFGFSSEEKKKITFLSSCYIQGTFPPNLTRISCRNAWWNAEIKWVFFRHNGSGMFTLVLVDDQTSAQCLSLNLRFFSLRLPPSLPPKIILTFCFFNLYFFSWFPRTAGQRSGMSWNGLSQLCSAANSAETEELFIPAYARPLGSKCGSP